LKNRIEITYKPVKDACHYQNNIKVAIDCSVPIESSDCEELYDR